MSVFGERCRETVVDYVQTVLIIDDGAGLISRSLDADEIKLDEDNSNPFIAESNGSNGSNGSNAVTHSLDSLALTSAFYDLGIVAGLYQPTIEKGELPEEFAAKAKKVSATADIIILDWMLVDHDSRYSKAIIKQILEQDLESGGRLRTIVIYTGESDLHQMHAELLSYLNKDDLDSNTEFQIKSEHLNIVFYNKENAINGLRKVSEQDLPNKSLDEFTRLVDGLIPIFAMKATSTVRKNTGAVLAKFDSTLDAGYLAHRALLPNPDDAEVLMLENYASYLRNILAIAQVDRKTLGNEKIKEWVEAHYSSCYKKAIITDDVVNEITLTKENFLASFEYGFTINKPGLFKVIQEHTSNPRAKNIVNTLANIERIVGAFGLSEEAVKTSSQALSVLTAFRRTYRDLLEGSPYLTQGTLIRSLSDNRYFVCVMPKCDTARVKGKRNFLFAKLDINDGVYDLIAPDITRERNYVHLKSNLKFYQLEDIEFDAKGKHKVEAFKYAGHMVFESVDGNKHQWIGDLEDLDIQNKVSSIVGDFNRIGVDEIEWVRRRKISVSH